jgi:PAS domain S-box-containing protein
MLVTNDRPVSRRKASPRVDKAGGEIKENGPADEGEQRFRALADTLRFPLVVLSDDGGILYANRRFSRITGLSIQNLINTSLFGLLQPDETDKVRKRLAADPDPEGGSGTFTLGILGGDGNVVRVEMEDEKTRWHGRPAVVATLRESERRNGNGLPDPAGSPKTDSLVELQRETIARQKADLDRQKEEFERVNRELLETNEAIAVLARNIEKSKEEAQRRVAQTISTKIVPIVKKLKAGGRPGGHGLELEVLETYLIELTASLSGKTEIFSALTSTEIRIATMIKGGSTSQEIADHLNVSLHTVKTHRRSIRKKLNIQNSHLNLETYLRSEMG